MKILHVISPVRFGGGESLLITLLKQDINKNLQEFVLAFFHSEEFANKLKDIGVTYIAISNISLGDGVKKEKMFWLGILSILSLHKIYKAIVKIKPDIIHVHSYPGTVIIAICRFIGLIKVPIVNTIHFVFNNHQLFQRLIFACVFRQYDVITCVSQTVLDSVASQYKSIGDLRVIYNCVEAKFFQVPERIRKYSERYIYIQIARFSPIKNHLLVIEAYALLPDKYKKIISIWFAGSGETESTVRRRALELNLNSEQICFLGFVPHSEIINLIQQVDYGLFPSDNEGFGIGAVECMAAGRPVLCLDNELMNEIVGRGGILVSKEKLVDGFIAMTQMDNIINYTAKEISKKYYPEVIKKQYYNLYKFLHHKSLNIC
jgi:glycosyltransferase involved in cell wall biosynthesis